MAARVADLERLYRSRYLPFRNALATITGNSDGAHDAVQEAFARALRQRKSFRGGSLEAWVWKIALRSALESRRNGHAVELTGPGEAVSDAFFDNALTEALRSLPPRRR